MTDEGAQAVHPPSTSISQAVSAPLARVRYPCGTREH